MVKSTSKKPRKSTAKSPRRSAAQRAPTIMEVAQHAGVSKSTVSLALQRSALIREDTIERVLAAAKAVGYVYNRRAAELRQRRSNTVGVVINDLMNPFFAEVLVGIERKLVDADYNVLMAHTHDDLKRQHKLLQSMREQNAAGIVLCPALGTQPKVLREIQDAGIALVVIVRPIGNGAFDYVGPDNEAGFRLAMQHLLAAGHQRIGFVGGRPGLGYEARLRGYKQSLKAAGIKPQPQWVQPEAPTRAGGHAAMHRLIASAPNVSAVVCYNDITAFGAMLALDETGLRAGVDVAVVGHDNVLASQHSNPPLSTIDVRPEELGEQAAQALLDRIAHPRSPRRVQMLTPTLSLRRSG